MIEFFSMGGHGAFIWTGYGVSALVLIALIFSRHSESRALSKKRAMAIDEETGREN